MKQPKNVSLLVGLSIPVLMIAVIAASIYLPGLFASLPKSNFLYETGDDYYDARAYVVEHNKLAKREIKYPENYTPGVIRFFVHDVSANKSREVSFEEAQQLSLDPNVKSPDGYEVAYGSGGDYGLFSLFSSASRDYNNTYLRGHGTSRKLELQTSSDGRPYYYGSGRQGFLGWIRQER